ncbi:hypothetical protein V6x_56790 [Gimesia chilikensis]|uniref:DUF6946 domain-containing protein n=1 Tax=Gimesia chilikensis TaxID=2605989 RepID=A0A517WL03_9PLAN|nr:hypothetical protein [Gimesia chilikensis]QDU05935.1 hypothetical protein V6x_56790 [Gimesia chilikensis]
MEFHFGKPQKSESIQNVIGRYKGSEFHSFTRSTIPMLSLLAHNQDLFNSLINEIEFPCSYHTYLEYTVSPRLGRGKASHTDVMLIDGDSSLAIEAKWTEEMYPTVSNWIKQGKNEQNRIDVLNGWLTCFEQHLGESFDPDDFLTSIYQMIHRAASAVEAGKKTSVAYFLFKMKSLTRGATTDEITEKLKELWDLLGKPNSLNFYVAEIEIEPTDLYESLQVDANSQCKEEISETIIDALQGNDALFKYIPRPVIKIDDSDREGEL